MDMYTGNTKIEFTIELFQWKVAAKGSTFLPLMV